MRVNKFRGYDTDSKVWRYGDYFLKEDITLSPIYNSKEAYEKDKKDNQHHLILINGFSDWNMPKPHFQSEVDGKSVGQFIGLKDKNKKEIYDGDIIKYFDNVIRKYKISAIRYIETQASFCRVYESEMGLQYLYINESIANNSEIIGNTYENPELLEAKR